MAKHTSRFRPSIRLAIAISLATLLTFTALLTYKTYEAVRSSNQAHQRLVAAANETVLLEDVRASYLNEWLIVSSAPGAVDGSFALRFYSARDRVDEAFQALSANATTIGPAEAQRAADLESEHKTIASSWTPVIALIVQSRFEEAQTAIDAALLDRSNAFVDELAGYVALERSDLSAVMDTSEASRTSWREAATAIVPVWVCLLILAGYAAQRWVLWPIAGVARAARAIAAGETSALAPVRGPSEISELAVDVNVMAASLLHRSKELSDYLAKDLETRTAELEAANHALSASEDRLNRVIESAPLILFAIDKDGICTLSRGRGLAGLGLEAGGANGRNFFDLAGRQPALSDALQRAMEGDEITRELRINALTFELHCAPSYDDEGRVIGVIGVAIDVSNRYAAQHALRQSEERYRELFQNANDTIYTHDLRGNFTSINKAGEALTGFSEADLVKMNIGDVLAPEHIARSLDMLRRKREGEVVRTTYEVEIIAKDGRRIPLEVSTRLIFADGQPVAVQGMARDVSDRRETEETMRRHTQDLEALFQQLSATHLELAKSQEALQQKSALLEAALEDERLRARIDPLTGALNHGGIVEALRDAVAGGPASRFAVFMLDIDGMKAANDMFGHPFGDNVLRAVARALSRRGAVVGRYGGDEFVALVPNAGRAEAESYRGDVIAALAASGLKGPDGTNDVPIEASMGYALFPSDAERIDDLIAFADEAMYAHRRSQPSGGSTASRRMGERAVWLVGELTPILTASGDANSRLRFLVERLALAGGYEGVGLMINPSRVPGRDIAVTYPPLKPELEPRWTEARREYATTGHPLHLLLGNARRPVIVDNPVDDPRLAAFQREVIRVEGLMSLMIAPLAWENELVGSLTVASRQANRYGPADAQLLMGVASQVASIASMEILLDQFRDGAERLGRAHRESVRLLASIVEAQAGVLSHDMDRLAGVASALARRLGFDEDEAAAIGLATMLHDIGKYRVPAEILAQPQDLTLEEYEVVKSHALWGSRLLRDIPSFELASQVARWHHERWDG
ncbi:MAG TPA: PAS domain S-box protein, partial [Dehalococcoidia bacterium]